MESKFSFLDYAWEIYAAAKAGGADTGIGYDMFRTDVRNGTNTNCGEALSDFDFPTAHADWNKLTDAAQQEAYAEWREFNGRAYKALAGAFAAGDRDAFDAAVTEHRAAG